MNEDMRRWGVDREDWHKYVNAKYTNKMVKPKTQEAAAMIGYRLGDTAMIDGASFPLFGREKYIMLRYNGMMYRIPASRFFNLFDVEGIEGGVRRKMGSARFSTKRRKSRRSRKNRNRK